MRHRFLLCLLIVILVMASHAQNRRPQRLPTYDFKRYHFGFTVGLSQMNFVMRPVDNLIGLDSVFSIIPTPQEGFYVAIVSDRRLGNNLNLRFIPGLSFGDRDINYTLRDKNGTLWTYTKNVESTFLEFPLYIKYKSNRINDNNYRAYLLGGMKYMLDLASEYDKPANNFDPQLKLRRDDLAFDMGVGFDFYMDYFKLGVELKMSYGVRDLLKREGNSYTESVKSLSSKVFYFGVTFE
jgi:hypothetical protein